MEQPGLPVKLGEHEYHILPQRHAKILRGLLGRKGIFASMDEFADLGQPVEGEEDASGFERIFHAAGGKLYEIFHLFIPDLMERWEFEGYGSASAMEKDEYDESGDRSPDFVQMDEAFRTIVQVNGLRWVKKLQSFFDPEILRREANASLARFLADARETTRQRSMTTTTSPSSQPGNGGSPSTTSGTSDQTPSPGSKPEVVGPPTTASRSPASQSS